MQCLWLPRGFPFLSFCLILLRWFWKSSLLICLSIILHLFIHSADWCLWAFLNRFFLLFLILIRCGGSKKELFFKSCSSTGAMICRFLSIFISRWFEISWADSWVITQSSWRIRSNHTVYLPLKFFTIFCTLPQKNWTKGHHYLLKFLAKKLSVLF